MQIEKRDNSQERQILIGMIVDTVVLSRIAFKWKEVQFRTELGPLVGQWCVDYYEKFGRAPGRNIKGLYESWASTSKNKGLISLVQRLLTGLSEEYKTFKAAAKALNSDYLLDMAGTYFNRVRISNYAEALTGDLDSSMGIEKALKRIQNFDRIEMGVGEGVDVLLDTNAIKEAFESRKEPLITYPGPLGEFFGAALSRDALVAFMGPEKRGKSYWLQDVAWMGMLQRKRVAYFEAGDMSRNQVLVRFMARASGRPLAAIKGMKFPVKITQSDDEPVEVQTELRDYAERLTWKEALKACERVLKMKIKSRESYLRLSCHPNSTLSVNKIRSILRDWEKQGWVPDIIVIDYADILAPPSGIAETRDQINATWKGMRAMSQSLHCLVVTATQTDAASYKVATVDRSNFSEDKRKLAHVTAMYGLNQTPEEQEQEVFRLNPIAIRDAKYSESRCVYTAACLAISRPSVRSCW